MKLIKCIIEIENNTNTRSINGFCDKNNKVGYCHCVTPEGIVLKSYVIVHLRLKKVICYYNKYQDVKKAMQVFIDNVTTKEWDNVDESISATLDPLRKAMDMLRDMNLPYN